MKDLGRLKYFLGIEVLWSKQGIFICQKKYVLDLLAETGMIDYKPVDTPMMVNQKLYMEEKAKLADKGSKKQKVVALSSAEAEFRGIARGLAEALWIRNLLSEIGYHSTQTSKIMCDNKAAIQISENPVQHDRTKHIEVDRHFIKEKLENGIIELPFVRSKDQLTDILTKAALENQFLSILLLIRLGKRECVERIPSGSQENDECEQNNPAEHVCLFEGDIYDDPSLLRFYHNDDTLSWGNNKRKEKREDGPEWIVRRTFEDDLANFMLKKKSHTKGKGEMLEQHCKELHEQFSQILSTIRKRKTPEPEAPTFAIMTRSGVSTQDPPFPAPPQSTSANHTERETEKEGHEGAKPSIIQEPAPRPSIFYQPSKSSNLPFLSRLKKQKRMTRINGFSKSLNRFTSVYRS
nr:putative reverse transcriptase, RNA-dependent DNA polymerase [Tanacetum cinerariifolium]